MRVTCLANFDFEALRGKDMACLLSKFGLQPCSSSDRNYWLTFLMVFNISELLIVNMNDLY